MRAPAHRRFRGAPARLSLYAMLMVTLVGAGPAEASEALSYRWSLKGFVGRLAGAVMPNQGHGELRTRRNDGGRITELEITSPHSERGEFFLYGGETGADGSTQRAWSAYRWRGRAKSEKSPVAEAGVVDVASGIALLRDRHPTEPLPMRIWSDGKVYPVIAERVGTERVVVPAGAFLADHYSIRGVKPSGRGRRQWKGGLDVWLARDPQATPVRIQVERGFANVRLELLPANAAGGAGRR